MSVDNPLEPGDETHEFSPDEVGAESGEEFAGTPQKSLLNANTLLLLGLLAAVGGGTYVMCMRASAQPLTPDPAAAKEAATINTFLKGGAKEQYQLAAVQRDTEKIVGEFSGYSSARQVPLNDLHANPFRSSDDDKPTSLEEDKQQSLIEAHKQAEQAAVKDLKLQSVVFGSHSICMINGRPYIAGQGNGTFVVESIESSGVWIRIGDLRVELTIKQASANVETN